MVLDGKIAYVVSFRPNKKSSYAIFTRVKSEKLTREMDTAIACFFLSSGLPTEPIFEILKPLNQLFTEFLSI